jgi:hypothetical protein
MPSNGPDLSGGFTNRQSGADFAGGHGEISAFVIEKCRIRSTANAKP